MSRKCGEGLQKIRETYSVDEVGSFSRPASGDVLVFDLNLLGEDVVADLLARLSDVGSL